MVESRRHGPALEETGLKAPEVLARIPGRELDRIEMQHPFLERKVLGVLADYVTAEDGTGCVHTAPAPRPRGLRNGHEVRPGNLLPVGDAGEFTEGLPEYEGKKVFEANESIIELLKARGAWWGRRDG